MQPVIAQLCESNLAFFANTVLLGPKEPPFNGEFLIAPHHEEWAQLANEYDQLVILASRGCSKSETWTVAFSLWMITKADGGSGLILSGSDDQAIKQLAKIKKQIEENPRLQYLMPSPNERGSKWSEHHIRLSNGREIMAKGFMSRMRGGHPRWVVLDDVVNEESAFSDTQREKMKHFFFSVVYNMKHTAKINFVVVGTPVAAGDLYDILEQTKEFECRRYPAISYWDQEAPVAPENYDPEKHQRRALWPEVLPLEELDRIKRVSGELVFARERMCEIVNDDASIFPYRLFRQPEMMVDTVTLGRPAAYWDSIGVHARYIGVDFAISTSVGADYTVLFVVGLDDHGNRWIIDIIRDRGLDFQDALLLIKEAHQKYQTTLVCCEANQMQRIFGDELIRTSDVPIKQVVTGAEKHSLSKGLPSLRVLLENRKYRIPRGDDHSVEMTDIWISEMRAHTFAKGRIKTSAKHDDVAMGAFVCEKGIASSSFSFAFSPDHQPGAPELSSEVLPDQVQPKANEHATQIIEGDRVLTVTAEAKHPRYKANITDLLGLGGDQPPKPKEQGAPTARDVLSGAGWH